MATAREKLLQALLVILSQSKGPASETELKRLLNTYRVQIKPNENIEKNQIARDVLIANILATWQTRGAMEKSDINRIISPFRMQLKQACVGRSAEPRGQAEREKDQVGVDKKNRLSVQEHISQQENAYFRDKNEPVAVKTGVSTPVAGGPASKNSGRGQCPKCRSIGLVLARSYGGEDYHSCIYCGYQSHLSKIDPKLDLPLAAHLLGSAFANPEFDGDE